MSEPYDELYRALGRVVHEWSWLEADISRLVFDLCAIHSDQFYENDGVARVSQTLHADIDLKTNISIAKSLAKQVDRYPRLFDMVEAALNLINNDLRNERNRYIHDRWVLIGGRPVRYKPGTAIRKLPPGGEKILEFGQDRQFSSIADLDDFGDFIHKTRLSVIRAGDYARGIYRKIYPPSE